MRKIRFLSLILLICAMFTVFSPAGYALEFPTVNAQAFVVADMVSGNILYSQNMDQERSPASLTKIMTGLIAVEAVESGRISLDTMITAPDNCRDGLDEESSTAGIKPGEIMSFKDLIYCAMVHSANEACNIIAYAVSGSVEAFVAEMNAKAIELGATHTRFLDTNGLTNDTANHHTTAYDLFIIANEAMKHPLFNSVVSTPHYTVPATNLAAARDLSNSNALICEDGYYGPNYVYEGAKGIKTGYTRAAGYCLVSTATRNEVQVLCVVLGCDGWLNAQIYDYGNFSASIKLYNWAFDNYSYRTVVTAGDPLKEVEVTYAKDGKKAVLRAEETARLLIPIEATDSDIVINYDIYEDKLTAPIEPRTVLGEAEIFVSGVKSGKINLVSMDTIEIDKAQQFKMAVRNFLSSGWLKTIFILAVIAVAVYFCLQVRTTLRKKKKRKARDYAEAQRRKQQQLQQQRAQIEARKWAEESRQERQQSQYYQQRQQPQQGQQPRYPQQGQQPRYPQQGQQPQQSRYPQQSQQQRYSQQQPQQSQSPRYAQQPQQRRYTPQHTQQPQQRQQNYYNTDESSSYSSLSPATRELNQDELDEIIRSLGLDKNY